MLKKILPTIFTIIMYSMQIFAQPNSLDTVFNPGIGPNGIVTAISIQTDEKIIIGGHFTEFNGISRNSIARINSDASLDTLFNPGTGANNTIRVTKIQSDGKILIGGGFDTINSLPSKGLARLNSNGDLDTTFNIGIGTNNSVMAFAIQSDGKIVIGGSFTTYNGIQRNYIARLYDNGILDTLFNQGIGPNFVVYSIAIQSNGKIIIGGAFTEYDGISINSIARLNTDGTLDTLFNPGTGGNLGVSSTSIQNDGKIIVTGSFTLFNGILKNRIVRLNPNGSIDATFNTGTGFNDPFVIASIQSNEKILVCGDFTSYNGIPIKYLTRLNTDGTIDNSLNANVGPNYWINIAAFQSDDKIIIGGYFTAYDGIVRNRIARINAENKENILNENQYMANTILYPNPSFDKLTLSTDDFSHAIVSLYNSTGQLIMQKNNIEGSILEIDLRNLPNGFYIVEINKLTNSNRLKISKQ